jgi:nucleotide sugar dehydrogenase
MSVSAALAFPQRSKTMEDFLNEFKKKAQRRQIKIAVVGLGYVGLPLAIEFAKKGFPVLGIDIDKDRIRHLRQRQSYITDVSTANLRKVLSSGHFAAGSDFSALKDTDVIIICVPTPLKRKYHPDISYIKQAMRSIARHLKKKALVVLESTTYPGTTEEIIVPLLESYGLRYSRDFFLCFSPERIDPGNKKYPVHKIPKIVGGIDSAATELAGIVYGNIIEKVVPVSSARVAEVAKLLENTFRLVNIGLVDELAMMAHKMHIDIWEVIEAAKTKPFGFMPFYPGPGVGGHCLDENESVFVKEDNFLKTMLISDFIEYIKEKNDEDIEVLSFDPLKKKSVFKKVTAASARPYFGRMIAISTEDGRHLKVTDLHPMFVYDNRRWRLKYARDLKTGDRLPVCLKLPYLAQQKRGNLTIDLSEEINRKGCYLIDKIRVRDIAVSDSHNMVYSLETVKPHAFVTSYGIAVHNCIPKDPLYLYWKARHHGFKSRFIKLASDVISAMPGYIVMRVEELLKKRGISLTSAKVLVLGVTYKKDIRDLRKSPALDIIDILQRNKIHVAYFDPLIPFLKFNHIDLRSIKLDARHLEKFDCVIIATDHTGIDYALILKKSKLIFDTRNVYSGIKDRKVIKL